MRQGWILLLATLFALPLQAQTAPPGKRYAQELVDRVVAAQPELLVMTLQVTPPNEAARVIVASNIGRLGRAAGGETLELGPVGQHHGVDLPLHDVVGNVVGNMGLVWRVAPGQDATTLATRSSQIRDALARRTLTLGNLLEPFPFEPGATTKTRAQRLIDQAVARDPAIAVLALRGPAGSGAGLVLLGSTFGRHGKRADADDLKVLQATEPGTGLYAGGQRFGVDLAFHDAGGATVGTMNVGYRVRAGEDTKPLLAHALQLRAELQKHIASAGAMGELDP